MGDGLVTEADLLRERVVAFDVDDPGEGGVEGAVDIPRRRAPQRARR